MTDNLKEFCLYITEDMEDERVDKCLNELIDSLSRSYIQKLLSEGSITVNGRKIKSSYRVKIDDCIRVVLPPAITPDIVPENIPLEIL